jgi:hypothetical protein
MVGSHEAVRAWMWHLDSLVSTFLKLMPVFRSVDATRKDTGMPSLLSIKKLK